MSSRDTTLLFRSAVNVSPYQPSAFRCVSFYPWREFYFWMPEQLSTFLTLFSSHLAQAFINTVYYICVTLARLPTQPFLLVTLLLKHNIKNNFVNPRFSFLAASWNATPMNLSFPWWEFSFFYFVFFPYADANLFLDCFIYFDIVWNFTCHCMFCLVFILFYLFLIEWLKMFDYGVTRGETRREWSAVPEHEWKKGATLGNIVDVSVETQDWNDPRCAVFGSRCGSRDRWSKDGGGGSWAQASRIHNPTGLVTRAGQETARPGAIRAMASDSDRQYWRRKGERVRATGMNG